MTYISAQKSSPPLLSNLFTNPSSQLLVLKFYCSVVEFAFAFWVEGVVLLFFNYVSGSMLCALYCLL